MAHLEQFSFVCRVRAMFPRYFTRARVIGVGTKDLNGQKQLIRVEDLFVNCKMEGIDHEPGLGVTWVGEAADYQGEVGSADCVYSCEALEHDKGWQATLIRMRHWTRSGGLLFLTCAGPGRKEHGTWGHDPQMSPATLNHYRNLSIEDIDEVLRAEQFFEWYAYERNGASCDTYFWGITR